MTSCHCLTSPSHNWKKSYVLFPAEKSSLRITENKRKRKEKISRVTHPTEKTIDPQQQKNITRLYWSVTGCQAPFLFPINYILSTGIIHWACLTELDSTCLLSRSANHCVRSDEFLWQLVHWTLVASFALFLSDFCVSSCHRFSQVHVLLHLNLVFFCGGISATVNSGLPWLCYQRLVWGCTHRWTPHRYTPQCGRGPGTTLAIELAKGWGWVVRVCAFSFQTYSSVSSSSPQQPPTGKPKPKPRFRSFTGILEIRPRPSLRSTLHRV